MKRNITFPVVQQYNRSTAVQLEYPEKLVLAVVCTIIQCFCSAMMKRNVTFPVVLRMFLCTTPSLTVYNARRGFHNATGGNGTRTV